MSSRVQAVAVVVAAVVVAAVIGAWALVVEPQQRAETLARAEATAIPVPAQSATAAPAPAPVTAAFIGDSYTAGTGASDPAHSWAGLFAAARGWDAANLARGGTGYLTSPTGAKAREACGEDVCPNYAAEIHDAAQARPDVVVVAGGRNDGSAVTPALRDAVTGFYQALRAALPNARIVAISPIWAADTPQPDPAEYKALVRQAATAVGGEYVELGEPFAGHPEMIGPDRVHPNQSGHAYLAEVVGRAVKAGA